MKIIGFNLTKISVEKEEKPQRNVSINQNINIESINKEKIPISDLEALNIKFNLSIAYSENYAKLEFEGSLVILPEKDELKEFLDSWKNKKIPEKAKIPLFNFIMNKCNVKALYLEDELGLPLHIPMPRISPQNQKKDLN
ncbi:hypothetical protein J4221_02770 [Candidatus Pacearchaeota archaeon]|nr:hypothetical protein [Candidatus Pacearchaeota archaeon]